MIDSSTLRAHADSRARTHVCAAGLLRLSAKHRLKLAQLRDRFPHIVTRRFLVLHRAVKEMEGGDVSSMFTLPRGTREARQFFRPDLAGFDMEFDVPAHGKLVVHSRWITEIRP